MVWVGLPLKSVYLYLVPISMYFSKVLGCSLFNEQMLQITNDKLQFYNCNSGVLVVALVNVRKSCS